MQELYFSGRLRFIILLLSLITVFRIDSFAQLGADCGNPDIISSIPYAKASLSTCGTGNAYKSTHQCANTFMNGNDYVFAYTPSSALNNCVTISISGNTSPKALFILDGCPDDATARCLGQALDVSGTATLQNIKLNIGQTYFIIASSQFTCYTFNITVTPGNCNYAIPPSGCYSGATTITNLPFGATAGSTCNAVQDFNQGNKPNSLYQTGEDYVYKYTPATNQCISVTLNPGPQGSSIFVYNGCPTDPKSYCIASVLTGAANPVIPYVALAAGQTYYIVVSSNGSTLKCHAYQILVQNVPCGPVGSTCIDPKIITSLPYTATAVSTCGAMADYKSNMLCNNWASGAEDYVFSYTPAQDECVEIGVTGSTIWSTGLTVLQGCPNKYGGATCVDQATGGASVALAINLKKNTPYYIVVSGSWNCGTFNFVMNAKQPNAPGTNCSNPYIVTSIPFVKTGLGTGCMGNDYNSTHACKSIYMDGEDMVFQYTASKSENLSIKLTNLSHTGAGLFIYDGCPNQPGTTCIKTMVGSWSGNIAMCSVTLPKAGTYYFMVDVYPGSVWWPQPKITTFDIAIEKTPRGVTCQNPDTITSLPYTKTGLSTTCMGNDYTSSSACGGSYWGSDDYVFRYDTKGPECLKITLPKSTGSTGLFIIEGCPNDSNARCVAQANCSWSCNGTNLVASLPKAATYYIIVDSWWGNTNFDINVVSNLTGPPVADLKADYPDACVGQDVTFTDLSMPCASSWTWSFPGGTPSSSTSCCPIVQYPTSGTYTVTLTACNSFGCNTITKTNYIKVK